MATTAVIIGIAANCATAIGIVVAIVAYLAEHRRERKRRELETFLSLNQQYVDYLRLFVEYPDSDPSFPYAPRSAGLDNQARRRWAMLEMIVCALESAFFLYRDQSSEFKAKQWQGWNRYIRDWCGDPVFVEAWNDGLGEQFDGDFVDHVNVILADVERRSGSTKAPSPRP